MNEIDQIRKLLANTIAGEKGWRKSLASAEGSYSRTLAEANLSRLASLRQTLLGQLPAANAARQPVLKTGESLPESLSNIRSLASGLLQID